APVDAVEHPTDAGEGGGVGVVEDELGHAQRVLALDQPVVEDRRARSAPADQRQLHGATRTSMPASTRASSRSSGASAVVTSVWTMSTPATRPGPEPQNFAP